MSTFAIGDIHGCAETLWRLLDRIGWRSGRDRLWLVGDLVNRGPGSLEVLRWAQSQGDAIVVVLGNHDLHLMGRSVGARPPKRYDTFKEVLAAPDRDALMGWLRSRPLVHREGRFTMVHAGVLPGWSLAELQARGEEVSRSLCGGAFEAAMATIYASPAVDQEGEPGTDPGPSRLKLSTLALTRLRMCDAGGRASYEYTGTPELAPDGLRPWFDWRPADLPPDHVVVFGHWAALGRRLMPWAWGLDSGCAWGGTLSAVCLEDGRVFEEPRVDAPSTGRSA